MGHVGRDVDGREVGDAGVVGVPSDGGGVSHRMKRSHCRKYPLDSVKIWILRAELSVWVVFDSLI